MNWTKNVKESPVPMVQKLHHSQYMQAALWCVIVVLVLHFMFHENIIILDTTLSMTPLTTCLTCLISNLKKYETRPKASGSSSRFQGGGVTGRGGCIEGRGGKGMLRDR